MHVVFMGAGRLGSALAKMVRMSGATTDLWDVVPGMVKGQKELSEIVPRADVLFLCLNSWHVRDAAKLLRPYLNTKTIIVSPSKGIEQKTRYLIDELLRDAFGKAQPIALLSGPMLADELAGGKFGAAVIATQKKADFARLAALFKKASLQVQHSPDLRATALAGVLKNTYALLLGITDALALGQNAKGAIAAAAAEEMVRVISVLHLKHRALHTLFGPAGLSDLIATGFSPKSTNVALGRDLVAGHTPQRMSEGFMSLASLMKLLGKQAKLFPLLKAVDAVAMKHKNAKMEVQKLLK